MRRMRVPIAALAALAAAALASGAVADTIPFPSAHAGDVFVIAQTVTTDGVMSDYFAPGDNVVFRAYAVDGKTRKVLGAKDVTYFYVTIPNEPNVKLKYTPTAAAASGQYTWTGTWTVPASYATGPVNFRVLVKSKAKRTGSFVQLPVVTSQLTISTTPGIPGGPGPSGTTAPTGKVSAVIYADSVNGTRPAGAAPRPIGCTQTNVFKRGEQFVLRAYGFDLTDRTVLSIDNVTEAHFTVPGQPNVTLNWGSHGTQKVFIWTNFWNIPADYPLGNTIVHISFTLTSGKVATLDYPIVINP
jgi:hypothetical protein